MSRLILSSSMVLGLSLSACALSPPMDLSPPPPDDTPDAAAPADAHGGPPDARQRRGAHLAGDGVDFRVWAPGARAAALVGDFTQAPIPMAREPGGDYAVHVPGARAGQRYRYLLTAQDGATLTRLDPYGRQVLDGQSVIVDPAAYTFRSAPLQRPGKNAIVLYELHIGSFHCPAGPPGCTFATAAQRLADVAEIGVNAIELMPANSHGSQRGWGYNPHSYFAPHAPYGAPDELRGLVDEAHGRGVAVLLDMVYNHYDGWKKAPLHCFDGVCPDGQSGVYFFTDSMYRSTPWGPRFDFARREVADFIVDNVVAWRAEYRIDGFRWDSVSNIRAIDGNGSVPGGAALLRRANAEARRIPGALLVAEDLKGYAAVTAGGDQGMGFDTQWDGGFSYALTGAVQGYDDAARNIAGVRDVLHGRYNGDPFQRVIYTETHDTVGNDGARLPSRIDPKDPESFAARKRSLLAAAVLMTAPGVPMLFQGQEMLSVGGFADPPLPLDWSRRERHARIVSCYRDLIRLRRNLDGGAGGLLGSNVDVFHVHDGNKVLAYRRWAGADDDVVVVANFANRRYARYDIGLPKGGTWRVRVNTDDQKYSADFGGSSSADIQALAQGRDGQPFTGPVALGAYSVVILTR